MHGDVLNAHEGYQWTVIKDVCVWSRIGNTFALTWSSVECEIREMMYCLHGLYGFFKYSIRNATQVGCAVRAVKYLLNAAQQSCAECPLPGEWLE